MVIVFTIVRSVAKFDDSTALIPTGAFCKITVSEQTLSI